MQQADEFFWDLKDWSSRKLGIIQKHVGGFATILGSRFKQIYYVDGFAGRGVYDNGEKGSPVLVAEISQSLRNAQKPYNLYCINVEKDSDNFANLCKETAKFGAYVKNYHGAFSDNIGNILCHIKNNPAIFFIDDFGVKGTDWDAIEKIIARKDSTDLWIRFDHRTALRLLGFLDSDAKEASGKLQVVQNFLGCGLDEIRSLQNELIQLKTSKERVARIVDFYILHLENAHEKLQKKKGFAASYPIISLGGQRKYHLLFACSHRKAATLANYVVNSIEENFQREKDEYEELTTRQMSLFSKEATEKQISDDKVSRLKKAIIEKLPKNTIFTREELLYHLLAQDKRWFGKMGRKHLTRALSELHMEAKIKINGTPGDDKSTILVIEQTCYNDK